MKQNKIVKLLFSMTGLIIVSKLLGFFKQILTASIFGATLETDIINLSQDFTGNIQYLLVQTLLTAMVAVYIHSRESGEDASKRFAFDVLKVFTLITAGVVTIVLALAPDISRLLAPTYDAEASAKLTYYLRLFSPVLLFFVWAAIFNALLHANKRFIPGEMLSVNQSVWMIALVFLFHKQMGVQVLALAFFVYAVWNAGYTAVLSRPYWSFSRGNAFKNPLIRQLLKMMAPLLLGYSLIYVNQIVDKMLVSGLPSGTVTSLSYASVLSNLVCTFITTFASIFFTYVTTNISEGRKEAASALTSQATILMVAVFLPISILTVVCAQDIVQIVFGRGAFGAESVRSCALALQGYGLMFSVYAVREVFSRYLYAYQDSRRPMINSSISIVCNIALSIALCKPLGVIGVTIATSVSIAVCAVLNTLSAHRRHKELSLRPLMKYLPYLLAGAVLCCGVAVVGCRLLSGCGSLARFGIVCLAGFAVYLIPTAPVLLPYVRTLVKAGSDKKE